MAASAAPDDEEPQDLYERTSASDDLDDAGKGGARVGLMHDTLERLDLLGDLDEFAAGGQGGLGAAFDLMADAAFTGPDDMFDTFESADDFHDAVDFDTDLFE